MRPKSLILEAIGAILAFFTAGGAAATVFTGTALLFDDNILNRRTDVGEAPRDPLVVPNDHVRHTGQRNASHIEFAEAQVGFVPKIRNLMPQMHVVRQ